MVICWQCCRRYVFNKSAAGETAEITPSSRGGFAANPPQSVSFFEMNRAKAV
jgi:hypothetical protein